MKYLFAFIIAFTCIFNSSGSRLPVQPRFSHIDMDKGLTPGSVNCFYKDENGFIWIGTASGLNRYDGYQMKVFRFDQMDSTVFKSNDIKHIFGDPLGNIWVQTAWGINILNPETEKFTNDQSEILKQLGIPGFPEIRGIYNDKNGNYWFVHNRGGLTKLEGGTQKIIPVIVPSAKGSTVSHDISNLSPDSKGNMWFIDGSGTIKKIDHKTNTVKSVRAITNLPEGAEPAFRLFVDGDDDIWIYYTGDNGLLFYDADKNTLSVFHKQHPGTRLNSDRINGIVEEEKGRIWVGTDHGGINIIDKSGFSVTYITQNKEIRNGLSHNSITSLYKDREGIIWAGTFKSGLDFYHPNLIRFPHYRKLASDPKSIPFDDVNTFTEDRQGNLWIGTNGGGLIYMNRATGEYTQYKNDPNNPNSLSSDVVVSLLLDATNTLWVGTYMGGLNRFDGKTFQHYKHDPDDPGSINDNNIWKMYEDSRGNFWVGTLTGGLDLFDREQGIFHHSVDQNGLYPLHSNFISAITEDKYGNLWVGTGNGIVVFNPESGVPRYYEHNPQQPNSLNSNAVLSIHIDSRDNIWVGTNNGLNLFREKEDGFLSFSRKDGLPGNDILGIMEDNEGDLWLTSSFGLSQMVRKCWEEGRFFVRNYDQSDGLQGNVFNVNSYYKTGSGDIIIGGANGFNIFNPSNIGQNTEVPKVVFTSFYLFNKPVGQNQYLNGRVLLKKPVLVTENITLKHDENLFSIEFSALNFIHPSKNKYKYKLEGFDQEWQEGNSEMRRVTYTNLDPGTYRFKVLASNNDLKWTPEDGFATIEITVLAPFYKTPVAYFLYFVCIACLLYASRYRTLKKQKLRFQLDQERREANYLHNLDLMKIRFLTNISHEFKTPLALILSPVEKLLKNSQENSDEYKHFELIHRNAKRLLNMVNQLLDFRKIEHNSLDLCLSQGNLIKFIEQSVNSFQVISENKQIELSFHAGRKEFHASFDMDKMEKILFNLLSNAFKFTPEKGQVVVEVEIVDDPELQKPFKNMVLAVKDNGVGILPEDREMIFERFYRSETPGTLVNQGNGIGLSIVKEFIEIHGGTIRVESEVGKGSAFILELPLQELEADSNCKLTGVDCKDPETVVPYRNHEDIAYPDPFPAVDSSPKSRILIIEDNEDFLFYLKDGLSPYFQVEVAKNGKEGWQKALSVLPDLIVSDVMMPVMNGVELCQKVRKDSRTKHIPFVLLTAQDSERHQLNGLKIGASDYVTKPFSFELLLSRVNNLIKQRKSFQKEYEKKITIRTSEVELVSMDDKFIRDAVRIIEANMSNPEFSVEELAGKLAVSRTYLYNKTVTLLEKSPLEFIRKIRLERGAELLKKSQMTIAEVAFTVGFNHPKYFSKYFKQEYHMLPSEFISKQQEVHQEV
ncbi:response regulator [Sinomicrobium pectinilyticum]|uniref:histidine kinase n=2 Tax=Sinomicrobium pectinilyticum TaxID=1084421 RepID=A0A3N0E8D4_SINP1|nr:response regulator [Sinomicrobium pectinilyticum]